MMRFFRETLGDPDFPVSPREMGEICARLVALFGVEDAEFSLRLVDDREIATLNKKFLGCLGPTNILSFPSEEDDWLGDLVLSADTLARETFLYNQEPREYTARLLAHGLLHLMGHDHGPVMEELTEMAVEQVGSAPPLG